MFFIGLKNKNLTSVKRLDSSESSINFIFSKMNFRRYIQGFPDSSQECKRHIIMRRRALAYSWI